MSRPRANRTSEPKTITLDRLADLVTDGQNFAKERWDELKADFDAKHKENVERRHALVNSYSTLEGRVTVVETKLTSIVGDNSGGSGLLHEIDRKQDALQNEMGTIKQDIATIKQTVEDTPAINKWVYGAIAVIGFLVVIIPLVCAIAFEVLRLVTKH